MAAGFLAAVGALVGAVAQSSELAREPVVCPVEFGALGFHVRVVYAGGVEFEPLELARQVSQADHAAQASRLVALAVGYLGDGGAVAVPDHSALVDGVFERCHMVRPDRDLRPSGRFRLAQRQRRAVGDLCGEQFLESFADLFRVALEDDVEVAAEPSDHRSDVAYRVRGHVVGDRLVDVDGHVLVSGHGDRIGVDPRPTRSL